MSQLYALPWTASVSLSRQPRSQGASLAEREKGEADSPQGLELMGFSNWKDSVGCLLPGLDSAGKDQQTPARQFPGNASWAPQGGIQAKKG